MIQTTTPLFMPFVQGRKTEKTGGLPNNRFIGLWMYIILWMSVLRDENEE